VSNRIKMERRIFFKISGKKDFPKFACETTWSDSHMAEKTEEKVPFYFIWNCVAKRHNLGMIMRSCAAFNCKKILVAGQKKNIRTFGAKGTKAYVEVEIFPKLKDIKEYTKRNKIKIVGVEIMPSAKGVQTHPFDSATAFLLGNEGDGLHENEIAICDSFVYIPHYGNGTASLNVAVAASIVFHQFALWANYKERERGEGHKFLVDRSKRRGASDGPISESEKRIHEERLKRKAERDAAPDTEVPMMVMKSDGDW